MEKWESFLAQRRRRGEATLRKRWLDSVSPERSQSRLDLLATNETLGVDRARSLLKLLQEGRSCPPSHPGRAKTRSVRC